MSATLGSLEFRLFRDFIEKNSGIVVSEDKAYLIESRLIKIMVEMGCSSYDKLYNEIITRNSSDLNTKIIDAITTNETLWFRDKGPWELIEKQLMNGYIDLLQRRVKSKIRIWSAASSTGQEAYSTAMFIDSFLKRKGITDIDLSRFEIIGTDISRSAIETAKKGVYDSISIVRGLAPLYRDVYFKNSGLLWEIDEKIKSAVRFIELNLMDPFALLGSFDIIFCRYVFIYFNEVIRNDISKKIAGLMDTESVLIMGSSEFYPFLEKYFNSFKEDNMSYYKKKPYFQQE